jgi:hypothetical protein
LNAWAKAATNFDSMSVARDSTVWAGLRRCIAADVVHLALEHEALAEPLRPDIGMTSVNVNA